MRQRTRLTRSSFKMQQAMERPAMEQPAMEQPAMEPSGPSALELLPPELHWNIVNRMDRRSILSLMLVCRRLYHAAYPHIWNSLESSARERRNRGKPPYFGRTIGLRRLGEIASEVGTEMIGFKHVKKIKLVREDFDPSYTWITSGLLDMVCDRLADGTIKLQLVELTSDKLEIDCENDKVARLLKLIKDYSALGWNQKPQIQITKYWSGSSFEFLTDKFALECITYLKLSHSYYVGPRGDSMEATVENITRLTNLLEGTRFLEFLDIGGPRGAEDSPCSISGLHGLVHLQRAISNLKYLQELRTVFLIFHPSFFIFPPESVKRLILNQTVSISWWRQFATCKLPNLEELSIYTCHIPPRAQSQWCLGTDEFEANLPRNREFVFKLGSLELRSLKRLHTDLTKYYPPEDLVDLILSNNPQLEKYYRDMYSTMNREWKGHVAKSWSNTPWGLGFYSRFFRHQSSEGNEIWQFNW